MRFSSFEDKREEESQRFQTEMNCLAGILFEIQRIFTLIDLIRINSQILVKFSKDSFNLIVNQKSNDCFDQCRNFFENNFEMKY